MYPKENLNTEQRSAYERMISGGNIFLTGEAGTGKSFLLNCFIGQVSKNKNVIVCAPTGIAALQINGTTIHRIFNLKIGPLPPNQEIKKIRNEILQADIIIIDEISMCRFDLFDYVCRYILAAEKKSGRKKQLIVVGDFYQLAPVMKKREKKLLADAWSDCIPNLQTGFAFLSPMWGQMCFERIALKQVMRQKGNIDFLKNLNRIRMGDPSGIEWFNQNTARKEQDGIYMFGENTAVKAKNDTEIQKLNCQTGKEYAGNRTNFNIELPTDEKLTLCKNARVMTLINDTEGRYQNGSMGKIIELKENTVIVEFNNRERAEITPYKWQQLDYELVRDPVTKESRLKRTVTGTFTQLPLKIAFAITIHKSQGQTFECVNLDPACFEPGQLYVALSRVTSAETLYLTRKIELSDLIVSPEVKMLESITG